MPERRHRLRNPVAASPLLKKGGVHQRLRSRERQREKRRLEDAVDEWLEKSEMIQTLGTNE